MMAGCGWSCVREVRAFACPYDVEAWNSKKSQPLPTLVFVLVLFAVAFAAKKSISTLTWRLRSAIECFLWKLEIRLKRVYHYLYLALGYTHHSATDSSLVERWYDYHWCLMNYNSVYMLAYFDVEIYTIHWFGTISCILASWCKYILKTKVATTISSLEQSHDSYILPS